MSWSGDFPGRKFYGIERNVQVKTKVNWKHRTLPRVHILDTVNTEILTQGHIHSLCTWTDYTGKKRSCDSYGCCHQRRICTPWFNVFLSQNAGRTRLRETSGDLVIQQWKIGLGKGGEICLDLSICLEGSGGLYWRLTVKDTGQSSAIGGQCVAWTEGEMEKEKEM